jgi:hypothetical protein
VFVSGRPVHDRDMSQVLSPLVVMIMAMVVPAVSVAVRVNVPVGVGPHSHGPDLDLRADHAGRHGYHEGPDVTPDVEQDRALPGKGVLDRLLDAHDAWVVPGWVW